MIIIVIIIISIIYIKYRPTIIVIIHFYTDLTYFHSELLWTMIFPLFIDMKREYSYAVSFYKENKKKKKVFYVRRMKAWMIDKSLRPLYKRRTKWNQFQGNLRARNYWESLL